MYKSEHIITSRHYLVILVAAFAAGIFVSLSLGTVFGLCAAAGLLCVFLLAILFSVFFRQIFSRPKHYILTIFILLSFLAGVLRAELSQISRENSIKNFADNESWVYGTISSTPSLTSNKFYYTFELDTFRIGDEYTNETIVVYIPKDRDCNFVIGESVFFWAELRGVSFSENLSNYDYFINLSRQNIFLTANTKNINPYTDESRFSFSNTLKNFGSIIRSKVSSAADSLFPEDTKCAAILKGLLTGDKADFDDETYNKFSNAGISHIVAVSGMHISILFSFLTVLFGVFRAKHKILLFMTIPFIMLFVSAAGFTPSALRASLMILIMILSVLLSEEYNPITSLFAAFGILIAFSPYSILSKSLVLSFSATLGIFVYFRYLNSLLSLPFECEKWNLGKSRRLIKISASYFSSSISLSISSFLGTAYFIILFFDKISKVQFLTNLWIIPVVSIIFCLGYTTCIAFYIFPWLSLNILKYPLGWCLKVIILTTDFFGDNRFSYNYPFEVSSAAHATVYFGAALIIYMTLKALWDMYEQKKKAAEKKTAAR